ncbi:SagB/ThcOx family dehydrogenase [Desulfonatronovibrio magnus]|uniref:SagB/ThcOx family dehydrogenase n=1 Tax=Desulfonatronovibrio magnus TaxID=698827 RepID=UPI0005EBE441|nr:SagB/ThcOx family dehydrogenase [Desulfonatronovibrio magnus]
MTKESYMANREFLKDSLRKRTDFSMTDQNRGIPAPPIEKPFDPEVLRIKLDGPESWTEHINSAGLYQLVGKRKSRRNYSREPLDFAELSFLLWATQGVRKRAGLGTAFRTVPSAGARHSFETYVAVLNIKCLDPGLYRFLPLSHELLFIKDIPDAELLLAEAAFGQRFVGSGAATFIWSCIPYRMEWRYGPTAYRVILMDVGHVCQNLYLACEAMGAGTCAVAAYDQEAMDDLLGLDGQDEFVIYLAPVGRALSLRPGS